MQSAAYKRYEKADKKQVDMPRFAGRVICYPAEIITARRTAT